MQASGVLDCEPRIVVVEVGVHVDTLGEPGGKAFSHPEQALFAVSALVGVLKLRLEDDPAKVSSI